MRKFKNIFLYIITFFVFFSIQILFAQEKFVMNNETKMIRNEQISLLDSIQIKNLTQVKVRWNEYNVAPTMISGILDNGDFLKSSVNYEQASLKFLEKFKNVFVLDNPQQDLQKIQEISDNYGNTHLKFNQYYKGLRVFASQLIVHFNSLGEIYLFNGRYSPSFDISIIPSLSNNEAIRIASTDSKLTEYRSEYELIIFPGLDMKNPKLSWSILLKPKFQPTQQYIVDAINGKILFNDDGIRY